MDMLIFMVELAANGLVCGATVTPISQCEHNNPKRTKRNQQHS